MKEYHNFLPEQLADELYQLGKSIVFGTNTEKMLIWTNYQWSQRLIMDSGLVLCVKIPERFLPNIQDILIEKGVLDKNVDTSLVDTESAMLHIWSKNSYIPEHADASYSKAITVYLGRNWQYNDGGIFHWKDKDTDTWHVITPTFNKAVVNDSGSHHAITPVKSNNLRISLQVFLKKQDEV